MAPVRRRDVHHFLPRRGVGFATALVTGQFSECEVGSKMFAFDLDRLADIDRFSPQMLEVLFSEPDSENGYAMIASFLWEPTSCY
jgi:hypothetical protein